MLSSFVKCLVLLLLLAAAAAVPVQEKEDNPICLECKKVISSLQKVVIKANMTYEHSLAKFLDTNICDNLPEANQEDCKQIFDEELPEIWDEVIDDVLNPTMRCADLLLCPQAENKLTSGFQCDICSKVTKYIGEKVLEDPRVEKRVALKLEKLCDDIPDIDDDTKAKCKEMIKTDTPEAMKQIGQEISEDLCTDANLCP